MKFFEDIRVGETVEIGSHVFTAEDIKTFAQRFDPQPFHVDDEAAARSHFGRLCASGWHTACVWMRLLIDRRRREDDERRARGEAVAQLGPSPGFRDLQWLKPVYVGDTVLYGSEVIETRPLNNRPGWGMISRLVTESAPCRCAVPMQSAPVSPPPMTTTCRPAAVTWPSTLWPSATRLAGGRKSIACMTPSSSRPGTGSSRGTVAPIGWTRSVPISPTGTTGAAAAIDNQPTPVRPR